MEDQKHIESQTEGEGTQDAPQDTTEVTPVPNAAPVQETIDPPKANENLEQGKGTESREEVEEKEDAQNIDQTLENSNPSNTAGENDGKDQDIHIKEKTEDDVDGLKNPIEKFRDNIKERKWWCLFFYGLLIVACLVGVGLITRAFICDCENVTTNKYASVLLYALLFLLIVVAGVLVYFQAKTNRKYNAALNRLELLLTRMSIKKEQTTVFANIDRELQLIARILESSN